MPDEYPDSELTGESPELANGFTEAEETALSPNPPRTNQRSRARRIAAGATVITVVVLMTGLYLYHYATNGSDTTGQQEESAGQPEEATDAGSTPSEVAEPTPKDGPDTPADGAAGKEAEVAEAEPAAVEEPGPSGSEEAAPSEEQPAQAADAVQPEVPQEEPAAGDGRIAADHGRIGELETEVRTLRDALKYSQDQNEALDQELHKRDEQIKQLRTQYKETDGSLKKQIADTAQQKSDFEKREASLSEEVAKLKENLTKVQAALEDSRGKFADLKDKFDLKERQYQSQASNVDGKLKKADVSKQQLKTAVAERDREIASLKDQLDRARRDRAQQYMELARKHIMAMGEGGQTHREHLELALQQFYYAGKVDPDNALKYRQLAIELLDEQMERIRRRKGKRAESDKQMEFYQGLRNRLGDG